MKHPRNVRLSLSLAFFLIAFSLPRLAWSDGCSCLKKAELEDAYKQSSAVFVGRVEVQEDSVLRPDYTQLRMVVLRKFKWLEEFASNQSVLVYTPKLEAKCGIKFQNGFDYLVFATGNPAFLRADSCTRTQVLENAQMDQQMLLRMFQNK